MKNLQNHIIQRRSKEQAKLKNKNNKNRSQTAGKGYLTDVEYVKTMGKGSFCKGLMKLRIEHEVYKTLMNQMNTEGALTVKQEMMMNVTEDYIETISLLFPELASNHLHNLPACLNFFFSQGKWQPEKFLKCKEDKKQ